MAISVVQVAGGTGGVYTAAGNFASNVTAGNTLFYIVDGDGLGGTISTSNPTIGGVTPTGSVQIYPDTQNANSDGGTMWMLPNVAGGNKNFGITAVNYGTNSVCGVLAIEVAGLGTSPIIHKEVVAKGASTSPSSGSITTTIAAVILIGQLVQDNTLNAGPGAAYSGFSIAHPTVVSGGQLDNSNAYYQILSSTGTFSITGTTAGSSNWIAGIAAIAPGGIAISGTSPQLIPPGLQSPMSLAVPARFTIPPAPQQQPAPSPQLIPPGLQSPMSLAQPLRPATQAPPQPPEGTPAPQPVPPGLQSPMTLAVPARFAIPPAPQQQPAPSPQLIPPGLLSPMSLGVPARPATQAPPQPPPSPPTLVTPPGLQSPMTLAVPARPATAAPPQPPPSPPVLLTPPGLQSPMVLAEPLYPSQPAPPQQQPAPSPQLIPPGLLSPMSLGVPPRPATAAPPAAAVPPVPGFYQLTPPGRLSPMSLGLGLYAPSPGPGVPPIVPVVAVVRAALAADYDGKSWWKKKWILRL